MKAFRFAGFLLVALLAALTYPGATAVSIVSGLNPSAVSAPRAPAGHLAWLHVEHPANGRAFIADENGRMVLLHGAVPASLLDFGNSAQPDAAPIYPIDPADYAGSRCPASSRLSRYPPLCQADIASMALFGFNSMRLPISWSLLEPRRGQFNRLYLDRIAQVVDWARTAGMYVILDMHQNAYSRYVGTGPGVDLAYNSGAPGWATFTDGLPSRVFDTQRELNPAVFQAATNFWYDRDGIQDEYIATVAALATRFKDDSTVVGYGIFNEPFPGWDLSPGFEDLLLFPFYRRVIDAVTGVRDGLPCWSGFFMPAPCGYRDLGVHDLQHLFFLEPGLLRQITDFPTHLGLPVTSYPNLVLDLHAYTHGFTLDRLIAKQDPYHATYPWGGFDQTYELGLREAKAINAALFVAEFGNDPQYDGLLLANEIREQEKYLVGFAFWTWKESSGVGWGMFDPPPAGSAAASGCLRQARERLLADVYPRASADPSITFHYDPATGAFHLSGQGRQGDAPTVIAIPAEVTGTLSSTGATSLDTVPAFDGGRLVTATPSGGPYAVAISASTVVLRGCA